MLKAKDQQQGVAVDVDIQNTLPGDSGVWFFIVADMAMFAVFFLLFMAGQAQDPETYRQGRATLNPAIGLFNSLILIFSGWWVVRAVEAARIDDWAKARSRLAIALTVGSAFAFSKIYEYSQKIGAGISLTTSEFYGYYFVFTGIHFLHFIIGVGALLVVIKKLANPKGQGNRIWLESVGAYWHMVDLLWILLFPMLYLAGGTA